jgi:hypothetical protein
VVRLRVAVDLYLGGGWKEPRWYEVQVWGPSAVALTGQPADLHAGADDHIFPKAGAAVGGERENVLNCTLIAGATNRRKVTKTPAAFLPECLAGHGSREDWLRAPLRSHFIFDDAPEALRRDDFATFLAARERALRQAIAHVLRGEALPLAQRGADWQGDCHICGGWGLDKEGQVPWN